MQNTTKISAIRGAGLSFPIACVLFFFLGQPYAFALVPAGALVGLGAGAFLARNPNVKRKLQAAMHTDRTKTARPNWFTKYLFHPNLLIRLTSLFILGAGLLFVTWCIGYYLLPEGIFRGGAETQMGRAALNTFSASILEEWTRLFKANMLPVLIILVGSLLMRVNRVSLGYLTALYNIAGYGLFIGTNSFAIPMPFRMAPSLAIFERSGPYEMLALIVLAAASFGWSFFEIKHLFRTNPERVIPAPKITGYEIAAFFLGKECTIMLETIHQKNVVSRTLFIWLGFSAALWLIFGLAYFTHPQAWGKPVEIQQQTGWGVFGTIIASNSLLLLLIIAGNLFVRFGAITPGLIILAIQAVMIGWTAGTNGFLEPFTSVAQANTAFLRIGLWETSAYALLCAVTLPKSLLVSDTFPARQWVQQRKLKDLRFTKGERMIAAAGVLCLIGAAYVEAFLPL